jgi:hypothetical protein
VATNGFPDGHSSGLGALRQIGLTDDGVSEFIQNVTSAIHTEDLFVDTEEKSLGPTITISVRTERTWRTIEFVLPSAGSAPFQAAVRALSQSPKDPGWVQQIMRFGIVRFRWDNSSGEWWRSKRPDEVPVDLGAVPPEVIAGGAATLWFLGKFADAYISKLADRLADSTVDAAARFKHKKKGGENFITIRVPGGTTTILLPEPFSEEARLAFIDLDPSVDGIRGKTLHWNSEKHAWVASEVKKWYHE